MRPRPIGLLPQILAAIALGVLGGVMLPDGLIRVFVTFDEVFGTFLEFVVPLIVLGLIVPAVTDMGRGAGRWLALTTGIAYASTVFAGLLGWAAGATVLPALLTGRDTPTYGDPQLALLKPYVDVTMAPVLDVTAALVLAFAIGVTLTVVDGATVHRGFVEFREIVMTIVTAVIIPFLPLYVFGIVLNMTAAGEVWTIVSTFSGVIALVFVLSIVLLLAQYAVAGAVAHRNPITMLRTMIPAYLTALGTSSSVATIPVTLRRTIATGVSPTVASFIVPLCASIHLAGSALKITVFSLAVMLLHGTPVHPGTFLLFVLALGVTMVAAPGVPGGAILAAAGHLTGLLGFTEPQVGLMIAIYVAVDSFGTATNVAGDAAIATIVDTLSHRRAPA